jgi:hypothetical protein
METCCRTVCVQCPKVHNTDSQAVKLATVPSNWLMNWEHSVAAKRVPIDWHVQKWPNKCYWLKTTRAPVHIEGQSTVRELCWWSAMNFHITYNFSQQKSITPPCSSSHVVRGAAILKLLVVRDNWMVKIAATIRRFRAYGCVRIQEWVHPKKYRYNGFVDTFWLVYYFIK